MKITIDWARIPIRQLVGQLPDTDLRRLQLDRRLAARAWVARINP